MNEDEKITAFKELVESVQENIKKQIFLQDKFGEDYVGKKELRFAIFMLYSLADEWKMSPVKVYKILNSTGILENYIIKCYDVLHTQGKEYLVENVTDFVREKGIDV